jgi:excisionase family DNA binding protein
MHRSSTPHAPTGESVPDRAAYEVPEVAVLLGGVTTRYVWTLISTGELPSLKLGRRRMVAREDIDQFIRKLREDDQRARAAATAQ